MKRLAIFLPLVLAGTPAWATEPDNLVLPPGFHASVVAEALGPARHLAIRDKDDIYVSTRSEREPAAPLGIIALRLGRDGKVVETEHFSTVNDGTGIRFYKGALYVASPSTVYRFKFKGNELVPSAKPDVILSTAFPPWAIDNVGMAFDNSGHLLVAVSGQ